MMLDNLIIWGIFLIALVMLLILLIGFYSLINKKISDLKKGLKIKGKEKYINITRK